MEIDFFAFLEYYRLPAPDRFARLAEISRRADRGEITRQQAVEEMRPFITSMPKQATPPGRPGVGGMAREVR